MIAELFGKEKKKHFYCLNYYFYFSFSFGPSNQVIDIIFGIQVIICLKEECSKYAVYSFYRLVLGYTDYIVRVLSMPLGKLPLPYLALGSWSIWFWHTVSLICVPCNVRAYLLHPHGGYFNWINRRVNLASFVIYANFVTYKYVDLYW